MLLNESSVILPGHVGRFSVALRHDTVSFHGLGKHTSAHIVSYPEQNIWDPVGTQKMDKDYDTDAPSLNENFGRLVATEMINDVANHDAHGDEDPRTNLDYHADMLLVGRHEDVFSSTGRMAYVKPYMPDYEPMKIQIIDAAVQYDCFYDGRTYILVIKNALYVPYMKKCIIPQSLM